LVNTPLRGEQLKFRLLWIGIFITMLLFASVTYPQNTLPLRSINLVLLFAAAWHLVVFFTPLARKLRGAFDPLAILVDVIFISWTVRMTGGFQSDLGLLYYIELILAALFTEPLGLLLGFVFSVLGLSSTLLSFHGGQGLPTESAVVVIRLNHWKPEDLSSLGIRSVGLMAIYLVGYVGRLLSEKPKAIESTLPLPKTPDSVPSWAPSHPMIEFRPPESKSATPVPEHLSIISHELRSPLTILRAYTDLLMDPNRQNASKEIVTKIDEEVTQLSEMVGNLEVIINERSFPAAESLKIINLAAMLDSLIDKHRSISPLNEFVLHATYPNIPVRGDQTKLSRAFNNLLDNAVKYSPGGGRIDVHADVQDRRHLAFLPLSPSPTASPLQFAVVRVTDSGIGMSPEALSSAFEKFRRLDTDRTRGIPGSGLGLYLTRKIIEQHQGLIHLDSIEGRGTAVSVAIPLYVKGEMRD
jgi:two-component sensor histidine kinase